MARPRTGRAARGEAAKNAVGEELLGPYTGGSHSFWPEGFPLEGIAFAVV
jgi:hypothetical protein